VSPGEVQPVSLWRNRDFVLLQSGQTISTLGSSISGLAFLFLVLALTHSPVQAGLISSVRALPFLLLALPARRTTFMITAFPPDCIALCSFESMQFDNQ
jgi:hypothetical protein